MNGRRTMKGIGINAWIVLLLVAYGVSGQLSAAESGGEPVDISQLPPPLDREVSFVEDVFPVLKEHCIECHGPERQKGDDYRLDKKEVALREEAKNGPAIIPKKSEESRLIHMVAGLIEDERMPPPSDKPDRGEPLTDKEIGLLRAWIDQGAKWPDDFGPEDQSGPAIDFVEQIQPILQGCLECHGETKQAGELRLDTKEGALEGGWIYGPTITPGDSEASPIIFITQGQDQQIPSLEKHTLEDDEVELLKKWIDQGAPWPDGEE